MINNFKVLERISRVILDGEPMPASVQKHAEGGELTREMSIDEAYETLAYVVKSARMCVARAKADHPLLDFVQTVARGNTDADDLATMANKLLRRKR